MDSTTTIKAFLIALVAAGTAIWGWMGWLIILWVVCMVLDYVTGSAAARRNHEWNSSRAREGLWGKAGMIVAVIVAAIADIVLSLMLNMDGLQLPFHYSVLLTPVVVSWYTLTELGSMAENAVKMGGRVPKWIKKGLKIAADALDKAGEAATSGEEAKDD